LNLDAIDILQIHGQTVGQTISDSLAVDFH
jgi:hypothetical protein